MSALFLTCRTRPPSRCLLRPHPLVMRVAISPDGRWVATASWHNSLVKVWDARSGDLVRTWTMPGEDHGRIQPGRPLAGHQHERVSTLGGRVLAAKGPRRVRLQVPEWNFTAFSPDGRVMARTPEGHKIQLLETLTAKPLATLEAPGSIGVGKIPIQSRRQPSWPRCKGTSKCSFGTCGLIRQELAEMHLDWDMPPYPPVDKGAATGPVTLEVEPDPSSPAPTK